MAIGGRRLLFGRVPFTVPFLLSLPQSASEVVIRLQTA